VRTAKVLDLDLPTRCRAYAHIMADGHTFSHSTAAMLHGMPVPAAFERDPRLHVSAPEGRRAPRATGICGHKTTVPFLMHRVHGVRVLSPADTWCTLATQLGLDDLIAAGDRLLGLPRPLADVGRIRAAVERFGRRRGFERLRAALPELRADVYSPRETSLRLALVRAGLPEPAATSSSVHGRSSSSTTVNST